MTNDPKILLAAGGTGGHIWPAISFGSWINDNKPGATVCYVCGSRALELEIYHAAGIEPNILPMEGSPFSGSGVVKKLSRTFALFKCCAKAYRLIKESSPTCCVLFGGYLSFPMIFACRALRVPFVMHEQNAYAGKVTRFASKIGIDIYSGWKECLPLAPGKFTHIGVPVRLFKKHGPAEAWEALGINDEYRVGPKVVAFTGSLGSQSIKDVICAAAPKGKYSDWTFILPAVSEKIEKVGNNVYLLPRVWDASLLFSAADMAVVRAGGSTLTEIGTLGIPALVVPWRNAADNHQYHNAVAFASENKAVIWDDGGDNGEFEEKLSNLAKVLGEYREKNQSKLYNNAGKICENLWLALSPNFERSTSRGTE
ncbi:MAG: UDP-N-acetylglucosamine--N-acetylmuramyl-(pentapeptide) pyrophosphoryl-undecaprenol N-acetylglucosamine transferase [Synergistaceae bacterium]|nr:UDP-N-acetylglucosamine--N-acetylmuramyl-(pentapeptide) pyrophosphoryl-undecaprenol N-acetylglucosamine transferase [Synergistaceae bacterium]